MSFSPCVFSQGGIRPVLIGSRETAGLWQRNPAFSNSVRGVAPGVDQGADAIDGVEVLDLRVLGGDRDRELRLENRDQLQERKAVDDPRRKERIGIRELFGSDVQDVLQDLAYSLLSITHRETFFQPTQWSKTRILSASTQFPRSRKSSNVESPAIS